LTIISFRRPLRLSAAEGSGETRRSAHFPAVCAQRRYGGVRPFEVLVRGIAAYIPHLVGGTVLVIVAWGLVTNILAAAGADQGAQRLGLDATVRISQIIGTIVLIFVFVPALIAALDVLGIEAISRPATDMLGKMLAAVPNILAAATCSSAP
jgi:hypothetical protein